MDGTERKKKFSKYGSKTKNALFFQSGNDGGCGDKRWEEGLKEVISKDKKCQAEQIKYFWSLKEIDEQVPDTAAVLIRMLKNQVKSIKRETRGQI